MLFIPARRAISSSSSTLLGIITAAGLTSGLQLCLDAGDTGSYPGSGQTWTDMAGVDNFLLGTMGSSEASDPTFSSAGLSSYFSFDGGDFFTASSALYGFMQVNNATFTILTVAYRSTTGLTQELFFEADTISPGGGTQTKVTSSEKLQFIQRRNSGITGLTLTSTASVPTGWSFLACAQTEASATGFDMQINSTQETGKNGTYVSPDVDIVFSTAIGTNTVTPSSNNTRVAMLAIWNSKLTTTNLNTLYNAIKAGRPGYSIP